MKKGRKLINQLEVVLAKAADVVTYVERVANHGCSRKKYHQS